MNQEAQKIIHKFKDIELVADLANSTMIFLVKSVVSQAENGEQLFDVESCVELVNRLHSAEMIFHYYNQEYALNSHYRLAVNAFSYPLLEEQRVILEIHLYERVERVANLARQFRSGQRGFVPEEILQHINNLQDLYIALFESIRGRTVGEYYQTVVLGTTPAGGRMYRNHGN